MVTGTALSYRVFVRNWWRDVVTHVAYSRNDLHTLVPDPGARQTTIARGCTEVEALGICQEYARTHKPGRLSRKAEYTRE